MTRLPIRMRTIEITATLNGGQLGTKQTVTITDDETASTRITLTLAPAEVAGGMPERRTLR